MKRKLLTFVFYVIALTTFSQGEFIIECHLPAGQTSLSFGVQTSTPTGCSWSASPSGQSGTLTLNAPSGGNITINSLPDGEIITLSIDPIGLVNFQRGGFQTGYLYDVVQWGTANWAKFQNSFLGCTNLTISATDIPNLTNVSDMSGMFSGCTSLTDVPNINSWNLASVTNLSSTFSGSVFNGDISNWNTSNVTNMSNMFNGATIFNQPIGNWNVSNINSVYQMFSGASAFNQNINNWDISSITSMERMFRDAISFNQPLNNWNTSNVTGIYQIFQGASAFNQPIGNWNISNVTSLAEVFRNASSFNQNINSWNVSNVTSISGMFNGASSFNQPLNNWNTSNFDADALRFTFNNASSFNQNINSWDVSNVTDLYNTFAGASAFNQPLSNWSSANLTTLYGTFAQATSFNQNINSWNTANVNEMHATFANASSFNQPLNNWNTVNVTTMFSMFGAASAFNQDISGWNTSNVNNMQIMFTNTSSFNQPISNWNTSNVTNMGSMFSDATAFNQPLNNWDVSSVTNMYFMFKGATAFNQTLENWNLTNVTDMGFALSLCGMDCYHYSSTLIGWANNSNTPNSISLGAQARQYGTNALTARNNLINNKSWTFIQDSPSNNDCSQPGCTATYSTITEFSCGNYNAPNGSTYSSTGQYTATIPNAAGCDSIITINLTVPVFNTNVTLNGASLTAELAGASYQWIECGGFQNIPGETGQSFTATSNGSYAVLITYDGCTNLSNCVSIQSIGLIENDNFQNMEVYPNPTNSVLYISLPMTSICQIFTIEGRLIEVLAPAQFHTLNVSEYESGIYIIKAGNQTQKFIKE